MICATLENMGIEAKIIVFLLVFVLTCLFLWLEIRAKMVVKKEGPLRPYETENPYWPISKKNLWLWLLVVGVLGVLLWGGLFW